MSGHPPSASQPLADRFGQTAHTSATNQERWATINEHPAGADLHPTITLDIPQWGYIFSQPPEEAITQAELTGTDPIYDVMLNGYVIIGLPVGIPSVRCHNLTVGFRTWCILNMGLGREREKDVIFDRKLSLRDETFDGMLLESDQRFAFSLIVPSHMAPRDWHPFGRIGSTLYAEIQGLQLPVHAGRPSSSPPSGPLRLPHSPRLSPLRLLSLFRSSEPNSTSDAPDFDDTTPKPPDYLTSTGEPWLQGTHTAQRVIRLAYNPNPIGAANALDIHISGAKPQLGQFEVRLSSDVWTVAAGLRANIAILDIPPMTTIFSTHITLCQIADVRSLRDGKLLSKTRHFRVAEKGERVPPHHAHPDVFLPALFRGRAAGGKDEGALVLELSGRVAENDSQVRPSTTKGVETPIQVSHVLQIDIFFSVFSTDSSGKPMQRRGPGSLQVLRLRRHVMLPAVSPKREPKLVVHGQVRCIADPDKAVRMRGFCVMPGLTADRHPGAAEMPCEADGPGALCACHTTSEEIEQQFKAAAEKEQEFTQRVADEMAIKEQWEGRSVDTHPSV